MSSRSIRLIEFRTNQKQRISRTLHIIICRLQLNVKCIVYDKIVCTLGSQ